jgi:hypothetical protein
MAGQVVESRDGCSQCYTAGRPVSCVHAKATQQHPGTAKGRTYHIGTQTMGFEGRLGGLEGVRGS